MKNVFACIGALALLVLVVGWSGSLRPSGGDFQSLAAQSLGTGTGTVDYTANSWQRLHSVSCGIGVETAVIFTAVVHRTEGYVDRIATIDDTADSFRWSALNDNDVILRPGDRLSVGVSDTGAEGTVWLSLSR